MRYRYVTPVLHGPWHDDRDSAVRNAIQSGQVTVERDGQLCWHDDAWLESEDGERHRFRPEELSLAD